MNNASIHLALTLILLPFAVCATAAQEGKDMEQGKQIEALTERVKRLEALVGPRERPIPTKPTMGERLDQLERALRDSDPSKQPSGADLREDLRQLSQSVQKTDRQVEDIANRLDRSEKQVNRAPDMADLKDLRRVVDGLQRQLDDLKQKLGRSN